MTLGFFLAFYFFFLAASSQRFSSSKRDELETNIMGPVASFQSFPFVALIVAGGVNNSIISACTGSILNTKESNVFNLNTSFVLTSTYCILNRQDPDNTTKDILYRVLIEDPAGSINIGTDKNYSLFIPTLRILHPGAGTINNYTVDVTFPSNGGPVTQPINISVNVFDVGLMQLDKLIDIPGVIPVTLSPSNGLIPDGTPVDIVGYGAPDFLHLHRSDRLVTIKARNSSNQQPDDLLFFHDNTSLSASTTPSTPQQGVEVADEGCPVLNNKLEQVAIGQATWRVKPDNNTILTFASFGPTIAFHRKYIDDTLALFANPISKPTGNQPTGEKPTGNQPGNSPSQSPNLSPSDIPNSVSRNSFVQSLLLATVFVGYLLL